MPNQTGSKVLSPSTGEPGPAHTSLERERPWKWCQQCRVRPLLHRGGKRQGSSGGVCAPGLGVAARCRESWVTRATPPGPVIISQPNPRPSPVCRQLRCLFLCPSSKGPPKTQKPTEGSGRWPGLVTWPAGPWGAVRCLPDSCRPGRRPRPSLCLGLLIWAVETLTLWLTGWLRGLTEQEPLQDL